MRHNLKPALIATILLTSFAVAGCSTQQDPVAYEADYPHYASAEDLCSAASVVVFGQAIDSEVREITITPEPGSDETTDPSLRAPGDNRTDPTLTLVTTVSEFRVDKILAGSGVSAGDVIEVGELGGDLDGTEYDAQQFGVADKQKHVLFLKLSDKRPASLLNPTQGGLNIAADGSGVSARPDSGLKLGDLRIDTLCKP